LKSSTFKPTEFNVMRKYMLVATMTAASVLALVACDRNAPPNTPKPVVLALSF